MIQPESARFKIAWISLTIIGVAIVAFGLIAIVWPTSTDRLFLQSLGMASIGMGVFGVMITVIPYRRRERWAWFILWYYPLFWLAHFLGGLPPGQDYIHQIGFISIARKLAVEIITNRFLLRDFVQEDETAFLAYHADPRYAEFCSSKEVTPDFTHELFQQFMQWATEVPRCNYQLAIIDRRNLDLIGCGGLRRDRYASQQAELGIELAPQFWGRYAYAIEVGKALINFGFQDLGLQDILGISVSANLRVSRLANRYGFLAIGTHPGSDWMRIKGWNYIEWKLTREVWNHTQYTG